MEHKITINKFPSEGTLNYTYSALMNLISGDKLQKFNTSEIDYDFTSSLDIEFQRSYDDSVNLILNNGQENPRIINSRFARLGNNRYKFISRNQNISTNLYNAGNINSQTDLFLRSFTWPTFDLYDVCDGGQLSGGNYIFYIKYADEDDNMTDIVGESSVVSIFNGSSPNTSYGVIMHAQSSKLIKLKIKNLDKNYSKFYLYYTRETCDENGISLTMCYKIAQPYTIKPEVTLIINGFENVEEVSISELNIQYNYYTGAKTQATIQNMLFLGNVTSNKKNSQYLQQLSYYINVEMHQKDQSIGYINENYLTTTSNTEYYDPMNIYYYLGYWPDEYYQLGVVYLLDDGSTTEAFMLHGGLFSESEGCYRLAWSINKDEEATSSDFKKLECNAVLDSETYENTAGIFKTPKCNIINHDKSGVYPLHFKMTISSDLCKELQKEGVKGLFFVRSKRIPTSLFQGFSCPVDEESGLLAPKIQLDGKEESVVETFFAKNINGEKTEYLLKDSPKNQNYITTDSLNYSALISLDPIVSPQMRGLLTWSQYELNPEYKCSIIPINGRSYVVSNYQYNHLLDRLNSKLVYIDKDIPSFFIENNYFSTRAGSAETVREFSFIGHRNIEDKTDNLARGIYCGMIGCDKKVDDSTLYTVKLKHDDKLWFNSLISQNNPFFPISNRYSIDDLSGDDLSVNIYRGDCFTNTVTIRLNRNFIDPSAPANDLIIDNKTWDTNYKGVVNMTNGKEDSDSDWTLINLSDVNNAPLGRWLTFKCLSNYNLGLRSFDLRDITYINQLGTKNAFYPIIGKSTKSANKVPESELLNEGYSITLGRKQYYKWQSVPYENYNFENRIAFSNIAATKMFTNGFRIFQGMSYKDIDNQYGSIVKLFPHGNSLLCIFEHGLALVPVNEKALLSTQEGLSIHLYGSGVLQEQVSVISPDYGSTWTDSLIKTPDAYYGVDTNARKIWKYNNSEGFVCISDFKIQSFLNENINVSNEDVYFWGATNIKTHYNNFKGDVMFTFYNNDKIWNLCYNERLKMWTSRYSWTPLLSSNINNIFYSFSLSPTINTLAKILKQSTKDWGLICKNPIYKHGIDLEYDNKFFKDYNLQIESFNENITNNQYKGTSVYLDEKLAGVILSAGTLFDFTCLLMLNSNIIFKQINDIEYQPIYYDNDEWENVSYTFDSKTTENDWTVCFEQKNNEYKLYCIGTIIDNKLYMSSCIFNYNNVVEVKISAYHENDKLETYKFVIGNADYTNESVQLYVHNIDSPITTWYDKQEPFEFEFVVNQPMGYNKIFNDLQIISNNAEPNSIEIEIIGDSYDFKKLVLENEDVGEIYRYDIRNNKSYTTYLKYDKTIKEYGFLVHQDCMNVVDYGRILGNISYIEGKWHVVLQPIHYKNKTSRLRDKWAKIRIKYSGEKLAIITAIQTLMNISYV